MLVPSRFGIWIFIQKKCLQFLSKFANNNVMDEIVKFYSDGCVGCKALLPIVEQLKKDYPQINFSEINIDEQPEKVDEFEVTTLPTLVFLKGGKEVGRLAGLKPKTLIVKKIVEVF